MKVSALRKFLDLIDNEDAEVMVTDTDTWADDNNVHLGTATELSAVASRKYVHPQTKLIAARPCKETSGSVEVLMLYVQSKE